MARLESTVGNSKKFYEGYIAAVVPVGDQVVALHMQDISALLLAAQDSRRGNGWVSQLLDIAQAGMDQHSAQQVRYGCHLSQFEFLSQIEAGFRSGVEFVAMIRWGLVGTVGQQKALASYSARTIGALAVLRCANQLETKLREKSNKGYHRVAQDRSRLVECLLVNRVQHDLYGCDSLLRVKSVTQDLEALRQQRAAAQAKKAQQAQQAEQELVETLGRVSSIVEPTDNENAWLI